MRHLPPIARILGWLLFLAATHSLLAAPARGFSDAQAIRAIVGEAANQGPRGMLAVAGAIRNRADLHGVYGGGSPILGQQPRWVWRAARDAWLRSKVTDTSNGGLCWESTDFPRPKWSKSMHVTAHVGKHIFYRP